MNETKAVKGARASGFTLIELMIVVAIIGILAAIAIPKFANLIRQSQEGATKGNLSGIRSALSIYYGDNTGVYPTDLPGLTVNGKYLSVIPNSTIPPYHTATSLDVNQTGGGGPGAASEASGAGEWLYDSLSTDGNYGGVWVNCTHTDTHGTTWTTY